MNVLFKQALAGLRPDEVRFILANQPSADSHEDKTQTFVHEQPPNTGDDQDEDGRRRRHIEREWPEVGTLLSAEYFGVSYGAEIIPAAKRLKSGKQIRITSGAANGVVCDSFSEAMLIATDDQRTKENLARKGVSNGWVFWQWPGKPENIAGDDQEEP
ncbi:MAG: hypothetical protein LUG50_07355 [Planctomycetaceae bacterium]|nr:hypothetical protein [Planctomycetaceae bacterium]